MGFEMDVPRALQLDKGVDARRVLKKLDRYVLPWLFGLGMLCYLDRTNLSFGALELNQDLGFDCSTYGFGAGIFFVGYALFQVPLTLGPQRFGTPTWLCGICLVWGGTAASAAFFIRGPLSFYLLRFVLGIAESSAFPTIWYALSLFYSPSEMSNAYAKASLCTSLAQVIGAPLAATILKLDGVAGVRGWQWLFLVGGCTTMVYSIFLVTFLAKDPSSVYFLTPEESEWLVDRQNQAAQANIDQPSKFRAIADVARDWRVLYLAGVWLLCACAIFGITFWAPLLIANMFGGSAGGQEGGGPGSPPPAPATSCGAHSGGASTSAVAMLTTLPYVAAATCTLLNARHAERRDERRLHSALPLMLGGVLLGATALVLKVLGPAAGFACLVLAAAATWSFHGPFFTWPAVFLKGSAGAAGFALMNSLGALGGFLGPYLIGAVSQRTGGYGAAMAVLAALLMLGGAAILVYPVSGRVVEVVVLSAHSSFSRSSSQPATHPSFSGTSSQLATQGVQADGVDGEDPTPSTGLLHDAQVVEAGRRPGSAASIRRQIV